MKVYAKPIEMVAWFDSSGKVNPVRFKIQKEDHAEIIIKIDRIIKRDQERFCGNEMWIFTCQSNINNLEKVYEIKYELSTCRWMLFKM